MDKKDKKDRFVSCKWGENPDPEFSKTVYCYDDKRAWYPEFTTAVRERCEMRLLREKLEKKCGHSITCTITVPESETYKSEALHLNFIE